MAEVAGKHFRPRAQTADERKKVKRTRSRNHDYHEHLALFDPLEYPTVKPYSSIAVPSPYLLRDIMTVIVPNIAGTHSSSRCLDSGAGLC